MDFSSRPSVQIRRGRRLFSKFRSEFGSLDVLESNARPEARCSMKPQWTSRWTKWDTAMDSQAKAFLVAVRGAAPLMSHGGGSSLSASRLADGFGSWQPWVAMGAAKAAMRFWSAILPSH